MEIRPMEAAQLPALAAVERLCFSRPWSEQALGEELNNPCAVFLVATEGDAVLGYAGMHTAAEACYLDNLAVQPAARGQGIGGALLDALETAARARGGAFLSLEVRPSNAGAIALYRRKGFREAGRRRGFYRDPPEDGLILTKSLLPEAE